eukprot:NODE_1036_length_2506_cov_0.353552.p1 type:complete len:325 gc:universal NODE_1036_length_2506_cov_0.353552:2109-1135(-)
MLKQFAKSMSTIHKVVIVGSGPSAHTAAIYTSRAMLKPVLYEGFLASGIAAGGQLTTTTEVENFPGHITISGMALTDKFREQSIHNGTEVITETITSITKKNDIFILKNEENEEIQAHSVIVATGATAKRLFLPGEDVYWQKGISACAVCDGASPIFRNVELAVVGGGDSACEEATFLTKYASKVYMLVRRNEFRASKVMQERVFKNKKIEVLWNTAPIKCDGNGKLLQKLTLMDTQTQKTRDLSVNGLFYAIGHVPNTKWLNSLVELDEDGYIKVHGTHTNVPGLFASGDVADKKYRQAITAAGTGCMAALDCEHYLSSLDLQ